VATTLPASGEPPALRDDLWSPLLVP
jgi:hypothetical protein